MDFETFKTAAKSLEINVDNFQFSKLQVYFKLLIEENQKVNLTAITEDEDVFLLHFLDSMTAINFIPQNASVCDIGTGAGFPGVVLKIMRPDIKLTLIDSLNKRITFLNNLLNSLEIPGVTCLHLRAEDAAKTALRESFDIVVSRAVAKLNTLYEYTLPLVKVGGTFIAYKANCEEELCGSKNVPQILGCDAARANFFTLPIKNVSRSLIFVKKNRHTPPKFPRGKNKEREEPLF